MGARKCRDEVLLALEMIETRYRQWQIHRADFQRLLYEAAIKVGVEVEFGKKITSVDGETGTVLSEDDTSLAADLVIGADGTIVPLIWLTRFV